MDAAAPATVLAAASRTGVELIKAPPMAAPCNGLESNKGLNDEIAGAWQGAVVAIARTLLDVSLARASPDVLPTSSPSNQN
ncbi:hypothetical protein ABI_20510 [Asticcacaulis biprosthecium C19]|uniref:Uncharacterized protein n=1 Tax=Asticcacaulis biprosthecium C19 TaxID=715226 RepID=F4QM38_9CAUL|nr:hypothetical protein ABI_20510 [Asticcacaulis biprosthecium C19]